ncbi:MFS transporter [archaeon]|jgi:MFS family permease|nr:MFS transporter [archaeon]
MKRSEQKLSLKELKHHARRLSIKEGIFARIKTSLGYHYIAPFAIAIGTSSPMVALLSSLHGLLGPLSQTWGSKLVEKNTRKKVMWKSILFETLTWLPMIAIAILYYFNIIASFLPFFLLLVFAFYTIAGGVSYPAWFSWTGDLVDKEYRGRWFSKRTTILSFTGVVFGIGSSFALEYFKKSSNEIFGFIILFALAFLARAATLKTIKKQYEPKIKITKNDEFTFWEFLKRAPKTNFGKMALFRATLAITTTITSSLFAIYILRELKFDYVTYMLITFIPVVFSLFTIDLWGRIGDKYGNYKVLLITSILIPLIPILFILSTSKLYLILVPSIVVALSWAGFDLSANNFKYDNVSKEKRATATSYYNLIVGIGVFIGAGIGALGIKYLTISFMNPILFIFLIGGILRMIAVLFWIPKIKEVEKKRKMKIPLKEYILKEAKPTLLEEAHEIISIPKYIEEK